MLLRIAICDDMPENAYALERLLRRQARDLCLVETECFTTADDLLDALSGGAIDAVFLDIQLDRNQDGVSVARQINALYPEVQIVFVTAYLQYAVSIYDASHLYFLTKPISEKRLRSALEHVIARVESRSAARFSLSVRYAGTRVFTTNEVVYFERNERVTIIHTVNGALSASQKLTEIEALLPEGRFARPHSSYLVNLLQVCSISRRDVTLQNGVVLPVSAARKDEFSEALLRSVSGLF